MISGVGVDIVAVSRIAASINKESGFKEMVFSAHEINYCELKAKKIEHYAARFAAKEAFLKAIGTGWANNISFNEIEIYNNELGKPYIRLLGKTLLTLQHLNDADIQLSLSHDGGVAIAMVVVESRECGM
jgi:holo-[acyl-carrier protein] synthase